MNKVISELCDNLISKVSEMTDKKTCWELFFNETTKLFIITLKEKKICFKNAFQKQFEEYENNWLVFKFDFIYKYCREIENLDSSKTEEEIDIELEEIKNWEEYLQYKDK